MRSFALLIFTIILTISALFFFMKISSTSEDPILNEIRRRFTIIDPKFGSVPLKTGRRSYTENKSIITLCVVEPESGKTYDINTIMYVALHELAHTITKADGEESHGDEFKNNFSYLLKRAHAKRVYDLSKSIPITYCGLEE